MDGFLPVVISNTTGLSPDDVYVLLGGASLPSPPAPAVPSPVYFFQVTGGGVMSPILATDTTYSVDYSYPLSALPQSTTGINDYLVYVPQVSGARFYFSINSPMFLESDTNPPPPPAPPPPGAPNQIQAPNYFAFYDPNYSNLYETVEMTFDPTGNTTGGPTDIPWTAFINTTEVDAFGFPVQISFYQYDPMSPSAVTPLIQNPNALPSGYGVGGPVGAQTRETILSTVVGGLISGDLTGQNVWQRLAVPFYADPYLALGFSTYLRVLSPKQGMGNSNTSVAPNYGLSPSLTCQVMIPACGGSVPFRNYNYPPFPPDYITNDLYTGVPGMPYLNYLFDYYTGGTNLYITVPADSPATTYEGITTGVLGSQTLTFTGLPGGANAGQVNQLIQSDVTSFQMFSGSQETTPFMSAGSDASQLGFYFGDAFMVNMLPSAVGTQNGVTPPNIPINITDAVDWEYYYIPWVGNPNTNVYYTAQPQIMGKMVPPAGPWMNLYSQQFHAVAVRNSIPLPPPYPDLNEVGLSYTYDFDDSLGISGTMSLSSITPLTDNPYLGITLGEIEIVPDPYSDPNSYDVTFVYNALATLEYSQGGGPFIPVTNGSTVNGLFSNRANPLTIKYTNGAGSTGTSYFNMYLYYQFMQPLQAYNSSETAIITGTIMSPNSAIPTQFNVTLP